MPLNIRFVFVPYDDVTKSRLQWLANRAEELRSIHTLDIFMAEWERRSFLL